MTKEQLDLLPSEADVGLYREQGFFVTPRIFSDDDLSEALYGCERYYAGERDFMLPSSIEALEGWKPDDGDVIRLNDYVSLRNRELSTLVRHPLLGAIAARLSGSELIRLWHDQLIYKPADPENQDTAIGWHADHSYWSTCSSERMLTAWIPLADCAERNGPLMVVAGSHRRSADLRGFHSHDSDALTTLPEEFGAGSTPTSMCLEAGCVSFHHCRTIHASRPNRGDRPRIALAVHLQDAENHYVERLGDDDKPLWHHNDVLCRKVNGRPDYSDPDICPVLFRAEG